MKNDAKPSDHLHETPARTGLYSRPIVAPLVFLLALVACEPKATDTPIELPPPQDACGEIQLLLNEHCTSCHGPIQAGRLDLRDVSALVAAPSQDAPLPLIAPEDPEGSYLIHKLEGTHKEVGGTGTPMPPDAPLDAAEIEAVFTWIADGALCGEPPPPLDEPFDPNDLDQDSLFTCDGTPSSSPGRIRRIDHLEFRRRVGHSFDHETAANPFEPPGNLAYSTYSEELSLELATLDLYFDVLVYAGDRWVGENSWSRSAWPSRYEESLTCIYDDEMPDIDCVEAFAEQYLESAVLHRMPDLDEVDRLSAFAITALDEEAESGNSRNSTVTHITSAAWLHTNALFDTELGVGAPDEHGRQRLSDAEIAELIVDMIADLGPGAAGLYLYDNHLESDDRFTATEGGHFADIRTAAQDGSIQTPEVAASLLRQYAMGRDTDRQDEWIDYGTHSLTQRQRRSEEWMADKLDRFFLEFFDVKRFESGFQDAPQATSQFDGEASVFYERAIEELRSYEGWNEPDGLMLFTDTVARSVVSDQEVLRKLLTTREYYLPATGDPSTDYTPRLFGLTDPIDATRGDRWVTFPEEQRAGLLTHPVWLSAHGDAFEDGPSAIHRGKWIRENLFCETVPPLELVSVEAQLIPSDPTLRARDRIEQSISPNAECMNCHALMNDLGYPFEIYNHAGLQRVDDHGFSPDGSTTLSNLPESTLNGSYTSAIELMEALAESDYVKRCFIRQTFRFFAGRDETIADACVLTEMEASYEETGGSFVGMLETLATHDTTLYRTNEDTP